MLGRELGSPGRFRSVRSMGRGQLLALTAFALAVLVAASVPRGPAHATDPPAVTPAEDTASWNPGEVTYQVDNSGCHTIQAASIDTTTSAIADTVFAALDTDIVRVRHFSEDPDMKAVQITSIQKSGTHIALTIDGLLSDSACAESPSAPTEQASFATDQGAGSAATTPRVLGKVNLADRDQIALASAFKWFKHALKVAAVVAIYVAVTAVTMGIIAGMVVEGGAVLTITAQSALAGCIGWGAANLIAARVLVPDLIQTTKEKIAVAVTGCLQGAIVGVGAVQIQRMGAGLAVGARRRLNSTSAILGDSGMAAASQAGVDVTHLSTLVDGVADGGLRASQ